MAGVPAGTRRRSTGTRSPPDGRRWCRCTPAGSGGAWSSGSRASLVLALAVTGFYVLTRSDARGGGRGERGRGHRPRRPGAVQRGGRGRAAADRLAAGCGQRVGDELDRRLGVAHRPANATSSVPITVGSSPSGVAVGAGAVWVANSGDSTVSRIDPTTSRVTTDPGPPGPDRDRGGVRVGVGHQRPGRIGDRDRPGHQQGPARGAGRAGPTGIAAGAGYLWVTNQGDGTVTRFDPDTYVQDSPITVGSGPVGIAVSNGRSVGGEQPGRVPVPHRHRHLSVTTRTLAKDGGAYGVAARGGDVWVSNEYAGTLMRVTAEELPPGRDACRARRPPRAWRSSGTTCGSPAPQAAAPCTAAGSSPWSGRGSDGTATPQSLDRPRTTTCTFRRLARMTNDGLVGFRRAGGVRGAELGPGPRHHDADADRGRADLHVPPAPRGALLHRGAGAGRRHPPRDRTHGRARRQYRHRSTTHGDRRRQGLQGCGRRGRCCEEAAPGLRPQQRHRGRRPHRHGDLPPHPTHARSSSTSWRCRSLRGTAGHPGST